MSSPVVSIAAALLTSTFGFASGFIGYYRKGLIDFEQARRFLKISIPLAVVGSLICPLIPSMAIRIFYGILMLVLAGILLIPAPKRKPLLVKAKAHGGFPLGVGSGNSKRLTSKDGRTYFYHHYSVQKITTGLGGLLTGLLSTGIGEVVMSQLVKKGKIPVPVAAATSVLVVIGTFFVAAITHVFSLINERRHECYSMEFSLLHYSWSNYRRANWTPIARSFFRKKKW